MILTYHEKLALEHDKDIDDIYVELQRLQRDKWDKPNYDTKPWHFYNLVDYPRRTRRDAWCDDYIKSKELEWADKQQKLDRLKSQALRAEYV